MLPDFDPDLFTQAWKTFIQQQVILPAINPCIANSWQRCWARMNPHRHIRLPQLNSEHLLAAQVSSFELISLARPILEDIYQFIAGSDTALLLTNAAGYVLDLLGDPDMINIVDDYGIRAGTLISEGEMGTNGFALAIHDRTPLRVAGGEHYLEYFHELAETAAPVFDLAGRPMGAIGIINLFHNYHPHSLGLVVAGARAIEAQHQADFWLAEQNSQMDRLNAIVETSTDGLIILDVHGVVMHMNQAATQLVDLPYQKVMGHRISDFVEYPGFVDEAVTNRDLLTGVEVTLHFGERSVNCILSVKYVMNEKAIRWVIITLRQEKEVRELVQQQVGAQAPVTLEGIPGTSPAVRRIQRFVKVAAPAQASILIRGESGTGKNVLASAIHNASPRRDGPFLIVGCTSIPHEWIINELLGFDESVDQKKLGGRPSKFELAQGGTLFFQNIDDLPQEAQAILLNVLDLGIVQRLGSERPIQVDVRIIASSSANIEKLIAQGNFRADLYYRLSAFEITLPPLREHLEDIPVLVDRILSRISRQLARPLYLEDGVMDLLRSHLWPGNLRELEAVLGRAAIQAGPSGRISVILLPEAVRHPKTHTDSALLADVQPIYLLERDTILAAARAYKGNVSEMARNLGLGRTTVWRRLKAMNISLDEFRYDRRD